ncbi:MAG: phage major tail tube protein [Desulfobulbaceae bacterium]|jgi:P2 family phage contractile tail tube protein|nr:phage major tail tube protein [Desulfobulbaceae bacterium]
MGKYQIPDKLTDFRAYNESNDMLGVVDIDLPSFEAETDEIKGAGLAGTLDTPALGQHKSMTVGLNFRAPTDNSLGLLAPKVHRLALYGSIQHFDGGKGEIIEVPCRIYAHGLPKKKEMGKFESAKQTGTKVEFELTYIKITLDGKDKVEVDKLNYIFAVDGKDYLAAVRVNLGLG